MCVAISALFQVVGVFGGRELVNELSGYSPKSGDGPLSRRFDQRLEF